MRYVSTGASVRTSHPSSSRSQDLPVDRIIAGDCVAALGQLPPGSVDLIFADPPYNLQLGGALTRPDESHVDAVTNDWDQFSDFRAYDDFTRAWLLAARQALSPSGSLWVIGSYHNIFRVGAILQDLGFWIQNDIIWRKANPMPNFRGTRFTNAHETLIWATKTPKARGVTFHYEAMKAANDDVQMRSDWFFPICSGEERLKDETGRKVHPTQKPEALLERILLATSNPGDLVVDPFFGSGTTGAVAKKLGRKWIGIERDEIYRKAAAARIDAVTPLEGDLMKSLTGKREAVRVSFSQVLAAGLLSAGTELTNSKGTVRATVCADGTLKSANYHGSIHRVGALEEQRASCNGWTYWYVKRPEGLVLIDELREAIRQTIPA